MSDIDIRFDGIFLLAALALATILYLLIAVVAAVVALVQRPRPTRAGRVAGAAALMSVALLLATLVYFGIWAQSGTAHFGTDWADLMVIPVTILFIAGCCLLVRLGR